METIESSSVAVSTGDVAEPVTAEQIIDAHKEVVDVSRRLIETGHFFVLKAAKVGRLLIAKKIELGHGNFLPWLAENIKEFSPRTATDYMKVARYQQNSADLEGKSIHSIINLRQAVAMLDDKPEASNDEREKPPFVIRINLDPAKWDEYQRKDFAERNKPGILACRNECLAILGVTNAA